MKWFVLFSRCGIFAFLGLSGSALFAEKWLEISPEDLAATECRSDPNAGAEVLYKKIEIDESSLENRYQFRYIRLKVYSEGAVDQQSKVDIFFSRVRTLTGLKARVVKPDGSIHELDSADVHKQNAFRRGDIAVRKASFSIPNLAPGDIIEYQYRLYLAEGYYTPGLYVEFQEKWPIRKIEVRAKPFTYGKAGFKYITSRCDARTLKKGKDSFYEMEMVDLPAFPEEPYQLPDRDGKAWLQFFVVESIKEGDGFWKDQARKLMANTSSQVKPGSKVNAKVKALSSGAGSRDELLAKLYEFCVTEIINSRHCEADELTADQKKKIKRNTPAEKTLERGYGNPYNIHTLFCSMAIAAGFDARIAAVSNRSRAHFTGALENMELALSNRLVAIKRGEEWRFYDPGGKYYQFGALHWKNEGGTALLADKKAAHFIKTELAAAADSRIKQEAEFELDEDGSLSGSVTATFFGHPNALLKQSLIRMSDDKREERIKEIIIEELPDSTIENLVIENITHPFKQAKVTFDVVVPRYAEKIGDRLFVQPSVFQKHSEPLFPSNDRVTDMFFDFRNSEEDSIVIKLPEGYELEEASAPRAFEIPRVMNYDVKLKVNRTKHSLMYSRSVATHGFYYPVKYYKQIKSVFDEKHRQDQHAITLKKSVAGLSSFENEVTSEENPKS